MYQVIGIESFTIKDDNSTGYFVYFGETLARPGVGIRPVSRVFVREQPSFTVGSYVMPILGTDKEGRLTVRGLKSVEGGKN